MAERRCLWTGNPWKHQDIPNEIVVAVVGAGLAGLACARVLARAGVPVTVLEAREAPGSGGSGRTAGGIFVGVADSPARLVDGLGEEVARGLMAASGENLERLRAEGLVEGDGSLIAALGEAEAEDVVRSAELLAGWGMPSELWSTEETGRKSGMVGIGPGRYDPRGGRVNPRVAIERLAHEFEAAGGRICCGARVLAVNDGESANELLIQRGDELVRREALLVVHAGGWEETTLDGWFSDKLFPVRLQHHAIRGGIPPEIPLSFQWGYSFVVPGLDKTSVVGGCRWATPHMETGEWAEDAGSPQVDEKIGMLRGQRLPGLSGAPEVARWSQIMGFTCDGLPLVGPLPGRATQHALCGWNGRPWSWAFSAGERLARAISEGGWTGLPPGLHPGRFAWTA